MGHLPFARLRLSKRQCNQAMKWIESPIEMQPETAQKWLCQRLMSFWGTWTKRRVLCFFSNTLKTSHSISLHVFSCYRANGKVSSLSVRSIPRIGLRDAFILQFFSHYHESFPGQKAEIRHIISSHGTKDQTKYVIHRFPESLNRWNMDGESKLIGNKWTGWTRKAPVTEPDILTIHPSAQKTATQNINQIISLVFTLKLPFTSSMICTFLDCFLQQFNQQLIIDAGRLSGCSKLCTPTRLSVASDLMWSSLTIMLIK